MISSVIREKNQMGTQSAVTRPALRYHGGKFQLANWIAGHFPPHRTYVEPFGGAASVLLRKPRSYSEVYNDLDGEVVNLFRVLRNTTQARELVRLVTLTPYARSEFELSYLADGDPVEQARRTLFRSFAGFGAAGTSGNSTGFRNNTTRAGTTPATDWRNYPAAMAAIIDRMRGVVIEMTQALECIKKFDGAQTLHYVDPPYPLSTRGPQRASGYRHELTDDQHAELAELLHQVAGAVVVSGYACPLYDELYGDWRHVTRDSHAEGARDRTEVLWLSPAVNLQATLFDAAGADGSLAP